MLFTNDQHGNASISMGKSLPRFQADPIDFETLLVVLTEVIAFMIYHVYQSFLLIYSCRSALS